MIVKEVLHFLEQSFPYELAYDFDYNKIGLTIGNENNEVQGILLALDLTTEVIEEAIKKGCNLIITHHPFLFTPITKVLFNEEKGELIYKMARNDISLIAMHTNMDLGMNGVADTMCKLLGLNNSNAFAFAKDSLLRYGDVKECDLKEFAEYVKAAFKLDGLKVLGDLETKIKKVAIIGGSGGSENYIDEAIENGCQCFITGEIKHHVALYAKYRNICLIEVNHGVEKFVFDDLLKSIKDKFEVNAYISNFDSILFKIL